MSTCESSHPRGKHHAFTEPHNRQRPMPAWGVVCTSYNFSPDQPGQIDSGVCANCGSVIDWSGDWVGVGLLSDLTGMWLSLCSSTCDEAFQEKAYAAGGYSALGFS